jgi:hypothetical protein
MKDPKTKKPSQVAAGGTGESANRRRVGKVVHDDRGWASVEWADAPQDYVRPVLELEDGKKAQTRLKTLRDKSPLRPAKQDPFNPYQRSAPDAAAATGGARRDLRKLSKWIKMMREIEERKVLDKEEAEKPRED